MERLEAARRLLDHAQRHGIGRYPHILLGEAVATAVAALQEPGTPCAACGYGGKHLEAPPCTTCPAYPKLENTLKLLESNGDRFRALTDERLVELFFFLYRSAMERDGGDIGKLWCDGKAGCVDGDGEIECDEERHRACILRWLRAPARVEQWTDF